MIVPSHFYSLLCVVLRVNWWMERLLTPHYLVSLLLWSLEKELLSQVNYNTLIVVSCKRHPPILLKKNDWVSLFGLIIRSGAKLGWRLCRVSEKYRSNKFWNCSNQFMWLNLINALFVFPLLQAKDQSHYPISSCIWQKRLPTNNTR